MTDSAQLEREMAEVLHQRHTGQTVTSCHVEEYLVTKRGIIVWGELCGDWRANMEIVINRCYGGFGLSPKAIRRYYELKDRSVYFYERRGKGFVRVEPRGRLFYSSVLKDYGEAIDRFPPDVDFANAYSRADPDLVQTVRELGEEANSACSRLVIITIPDDVKWDIAEDDGGWEHVAEVHRTWP